MYHASPDMGLFDRHSRGKGRCQWQFLDGHLRGSCLAVTPRMTISARLTEQSSKACLAYIYTFPFPGRTMHSNEIRPIPVLVPTAQIRTLHSFGWLAHVGPVPLCPRSPSILRPEYRALPNRYSKYSDV